MDANKLSDEKLQTKFKDFYANTIRKQACTLVNQVRIVLISLYILFTSIKKKQFFNSFLKGNIFTYNKPIKPEPLQESNCRFK